MTETIEEQLAREGEERAIERARKTHEANERIEAAYTTLRDSINGGYGDAKGILADLVAREHPTLSGQFIKAVSLGIMRRATRDPEFRAFDSWDRDCTVKPVSADNPPHPDHDGRHDCKTVIGAMLAAGQSYI